MPSRAFVRVPEGWVVEERRAIGPFVTRERYRLPDGSSRTWSSRRHRKNGRVEEEGSPLARPWWQPRRLGWWVAIAFMAGSALFALGAFPAYADHVDARIVSVTNVQATPGGTFTLSFVANTFEGPVRIHERTTFVVDPDGTIHVDHSDIDVVGCP